jgi:hypothetical protein
MFIDLFSKRFNLKPTPEGLIDSAVPDSARIGLSYVFEKFADAIYMPDLYTQICMMLRIPTGKRDMRLALQQMTPKVNVIQSAVQGIITSCDWWRFYDICEVIYRYLHQNHDTIGDRFASELNTLFLDYLGFQMREGNIEKIGSALVDAQIKEARVLLKEPEFKGADQQFEKAIGHLNIRPNPDVENCVKDAVGAIESVGRIITNNGKAILSNIIKDLANEGIIPKPLDEVIQKVYAYRGNEPGVGHGLVGESKVTIDEAEFILATSAAAIIYLVKKRKNVN